MAKEVLRKEKGDPEDYILDGNSVWITAGNISVWIRKTKRQVIVQLFNGGKEAQEDAIDTATASQIKERE